MNQIHPKSQTTQILYQPPTKAEMKPKSFIKDAIHNIVMALVVVSIMSGLTTACFYAADKEALAKEEAQSKVRAEVVK